MFSRISFSLSLSHRSILYDFLFSFSFHLNFRFTRVCSFKPPASFYRAQRVSSGLLVYVILFFRSLGIAMDMIPYSHILQVNAHSAPCDVQTASQLYASVSRYQTSPPTSWVPLLEVGVDAVLNKAGSRLVTDRVVLVLESSRSIPPVSTALETMGANELPAWFSVASQIVISNELCGE
jgi:hypothetical protein